MTIDTWLAISAGATFLLALAAFWAIWQNRSLQIRNRRERLLKEIIEWAIAVSEWYYPQDPILLASNTIDTKTRIEAELYNCFLSLRSLYIKAEYIFGISEILSQELVEIVKATMRALEAYLGIINRMSSQTKGAEGKITKDEREDSLTKLHSSANEIIETPTKIKTRDIG